MMVMGAWVGLCLTSGRAWADDVRIEAGRMVLPSAITFATGASAVSADSDAALGAVAAFLAQKSYLTLVRVEGHVDSDSPGNSGLELTKTRAMAVARALVGKGVACGRLLPVGFGDQKPVADNGTAEGKAQNRRIEFIPATMRGIAIGGMPVDGGGVIAGDPCSP